MVADGDLEPDRVRIIVINAKSVWFHEERSHPGTARRGLPICGRSVVAPLPGVRLSGPFNIVELESRGFCEAVARAKQAAN